MKVMGGHDRRNGAGRPSPSGLLQFNLSLPVASVVIGCEQMARLEENVQAALDFTPISEGGKQKLQEKVASSRSAWQRFLQTHDVSGGLEEKKFYNERVDLLKPKKLLVFQHVRHEGLGTLDPLLRGIRFQIDSASFRVNPRRGRLRMATTGSSSLAGPWASTTPTISPFSLERK